VAGAPAIHRVFSKGLKMAVQSRQIILRLLQSEIENGVFIDTIKIVGGFRGQSIQIVRFLSCCFL
jgi:hypothetical protein